MLYSYNILYIVVVLIIILLLLLLDHCCLRGVEMHDLIKQDIKNITTDNVESHSWNFDI